MKWLGLLCLLLVVPACSDGGSGGSGSGGGGAGATGGKGTGGAPSAGGGKSIGGSGPTGGSTGKARGAISLHITQTAGCSLVDQWQDFPVIPGGHAVTAAGATRLLEDGAIENGEAARVTCSLLGAAPPYAFMAQLHIGQSPAERQLGFGAHITIGTAATGSLLLAGPDLSEAYGVGLPDLCSFTATSIDLASRKVAGQFVCGTLEGNDSKEKCKAGESFFVFENCDR